MKNNAHPRWFKTEARCGCGSTFVTYSTKPSIVVEVCSSCHPFYTGKQRSNMNREGQVEKFNQRYLKSQAAGKK